MAGIVQEQHPDRTRLFMQWKGMPWPIMVDSLNLLGVSAVPITLLIDEYGTIRAIRPDSEEFERFLEAEFTPPTDAPSPDSTPQDLTQLKRNALRGSVDALRTYGNGLFLWGGISRIGEAVSAYLRALEKEPNHGPSHFRLGVAYRKRYDSDLRQEGDFTKAVQHWQKALEIDLNQYIWRRRIQQYGPRLEKPYSFYDWIFEARKQIAARRETAFGLEVEPGGAEFAYPSKKFNTTPLDRREPDPKGRIWRDKEGLINIETMVVPDRVKPGQTTRVHLVLRPNLGKKAHWNNEVEDLVFWIDPPKGWEADRRYLTVPNAPTAVSQEVRKVEFELKSPESLSGPATIPGYALYYVCEDAHGTCLYRRQDVSVQVEVDSR